MNCATHFTFSNDQLLLFIIPTEECNFRCKYCYESFKIKRMHEGVVLGIKNFLSARMPELLKLNINWFGGEPLLNYRAMIDIMQHAIGLGTSNPNLEIKSGASTNASLLTPRILESLCRLRVTDFQITLDGDADSHDLLRVSRDKTPTFDIIWKNLVAAHKSKANFKFLLRIHVNKLNENNCYKLLRKISDDIGNDERFVIYVRELSRLGGPNDADLPTENNSKKLKFVISEIISEAKRLGLLVENENVAQRICYASVPNSFVFRADGSISKCTVDLYSKKNIVGHIMPDGKLSIDVDKIEWWSRGLVNNNINQMICPLME